MKKKYYYNIIIIIHVKTFEAELIHLHTKLGLFMLINFIYAAMLSSNIADLLSIIHYSLLIYLQDSY